MISFLSPSDLPKALTLAGFCALLLTACGRKEEVLARVGPEVVTRRDFEQELEGRPLGQEDYLSTLPGRKEFLELIIRRKIVLSEAKRAAFERRPDIAQKLAAIEDRFERQRRAARDRLIIGEFFRFLQDRDLKVTDEEVRGFWENETEAKASHILVSDPEKARRALDELTAGASFEGLAAKYSEDVANAKQGGDLGYLMRGTLVKEFEEALFRLKVGETSGVVASPYGHHILRKTAERRLSSRKFEDVAELIRNVLEKQKFQAWVENTRGRYRISIDAAALESLAAPSAAEPAGT